MNESTPTCLACSGTKLSPYLETSDFFLSKESFTLYQCDECGALTTVPQPDENSIGAYYESENYISHDANKGGLFNNIYRIARALALNRKFKIINKYSKGKELLDVGCGTGEFLAYSVSKGFTGMGIEPSTKARNYAKIAHNLNVIENIGALSADNKSFNCITLWHVLEHFHNPAQTFTTLDKFLTRDGIFIVALPNYRSWDAQHYQKYWAAYDTPRHLVHFDKNSFKRFAENQGYSVRKIVPQKLDAFYISLLSEKYRKGSSKPIIAFVKGLFSNLMAASSSRGHSSLIYLLSRKIS